MIETKCKLLLTLALSLCFMLACNLGGDSSKVSKLKDEVNPMVNEAGKTFQEVNTKMRQLYNGNLDVVERRRQEVHVREALLSLDKSEANYNTAAQKMDEAGKLNIEADYKEYLSLKAQDFRKSAEAVAAFKELAKAYMDYSIDAQGLAQKSNELGAKFDKLLDEARAIEAKADKFEQDHKDKFRP